MKNWNFSTFASNFFRNSSIKKNRKLSSYERTHGTYYLVTVFGGTICTLLAATLDWQSANAMFYNASQDLTKALIQSSLLIAIMYLIVFFSAPTLFTLMVNDKSKIAEHKTPYRISIFSTFLVVSISIFLGWNSDQIAKAEVTNVKKNVSEQLQNAQANLSTEADNIEKTEAAKSKQVAVEAKAKSDNLKAIAKINYNAAIQNFKDLAAGQMEKYKKNNSLTYCKNLALQYYADTLPYYNNYLLKLKSIDKATANKIESKEKNESLVLASFFETKKDFLKTSLDLQLGTAKDMQGNENFTKIFYRIINWLFLVVGLLLLYLREVFDKNRSSILKSDDGSNDLTTKVQQLVDERVRSNGKGGFYVTKQLYNNVFGWWTRGNGEPESDNWQKYQAAIFYLKDYSLSVIDGKIQADIKDEK